MLGTLDHKLDVKLIGLFSMTGPDAQSVLPKSRKSLGLLAFLAFNYDKPISRSRLIDLFWHDRDPEQGRGSLRQCLHELRKCLGPDHLDALEVSRNTVLLRSDGINFDLWDRDGQLDYTLCEPLLDDLDPVAPVFDDWLFECRRVVLAGQMREAEKDLDALDVTRDSEQAELIAQAMTTLDPTNEPASRSLMTALAAQGKLSAVRAEFDRLERALKADGFTITETTNLLFRSLQASPDSPTSQTVAAHPINQIPAIALQLTNTPGDDSVVQIYAQPLLDECLMRMSSVPELRIVAQSGDDLSAEVSFVFECGIRQKDNICLCTLRLIERNTRQIVWSSRQSIDADKFHEQLDVVADLTTSAVIAAIERFETRQMHAQNLPPQTPYAYYLRSKDTFFKAADPGYVKSVEADLVTALEIDPEFEPACAQLIQIWNTGAFMSEPGLDMQPGRVKARALAERLLTINSMHPNAHIAMSWCQMWTQNFVSAERHIERAIALAPYEAHRLNAIGTALVYLGRLEDAEHWYHQAQSRMLHELDYQRTDYGELYYFKRDYELALSWLNFGERRAPYRTHFWTALTLAQLGHLSGAMAEVEAMTSLVEKRWVGTTPCNAASVAEWLLQTVPLRRETDRDVLREGLSKIGLGNVKF
ncbi:hypothetical protein [Yoonia sediminilitoris]|uniref:DNA-binding SARP family transcriptional activator n=1 Tax=Yoonia sediminilitoris TaxID=1286148 RepID=A0A2T6KFS6_9RHOB|nr:hypothetical protein [Yoonia sediminilitoris]PUB14185.1 DNA-binding SARP family transcriptional activator [Yoonia sediminilitoris]RCW95116.1 DNA-binding SARP family transcriptional activator [Yoonia sediminilitoris]